MTRVSVAVATYRGARYLEEQLRSILEQTDAVDEIVLGDDGSDDGTLELARDVLAGAPRGLEVRILEGRAGGVRQNFGRVLAATTGDVVLLSDQDDRWVPGRVAVLRALFDADPGLDLVFGDARLIDGAGDPLGATLFATLGIGARELDALGAGDALPVLLRRNLATGATMAVRRPAIERALPVPDGWIHDEWLAATTAIAGRLGVVRDALVDYRQHGANAIGVSAPTFRHRVARVLEPRGDRNRRLAVAARALRDWAGALQRAGALQEVGALQGVGSAALELLDGKAAFEARRAAMPTLRVARIPAIIALRRDYPRFASQGRLDMLRDLLQPA